MPERQPTKNALYIAGTNLESGTPNTGQIMYTLGGAKTYTRFSGTVGPDTAIWVGAGRLDSIYLIPSADMAASGKTILFYDSAVAASGGPIAASGHKVLGGIQIGGTPQPANLSGLINYGGFVQCGLPFNSGLIATTASGQVGVSVCFTTVISG